MAISAKEIVILLLGVIFSIFLFFVPLSQLIQSITKEISTTDIAIGITLFIVIIVVYLLIIKKIREVDEDIKKINIEQRRLDEKLKIHEQLINLEARIITLEKGGKYGKN